jgi:hypothetical protein
MSCLCLSIILAIFKAYKESQHKISNYRSNVLEDQILKINTVFAALQQGLTS